MNEFLGKLITLDTNVLIRFFVADDEHQHQQSVALISLAAKFIIPTSVFVEVVWVLMHSYRLSRADVLEVLETFVAYADNLIINRDEVGAGLAMLKANGDFADGINQYLGEKAGGEVFITFDKQAVNKLTALGRCAHLLT